MNPVTDAGTTHAFTILGLLQHADPVVQTVLGILVFCSLASWALILEKFIRIARLKWHVRQLEAFAARGDGAAPSRGKLVGLLTARASQEQRAEDETRGEFEQRLERVMRLAAKAELRRTESGLSFLATVGSTAPFIGLFGTVWGIMHSFSSIAEAKDTSLAVVAPGIAEALFATAVGLVAAIPAVIAYNQISTALGHAAERIGVAVVGLARNRSAAARLTKTAQAAE